MENYKEKRRKPKQGTGTAGIIYGNVSNASTIYGEEKFYAVRGHGFAAERANILHDKQDYDKNASWEYDNREYYARMLILPYVERKVSKRKHIKAMDVKGLQKGLRIVLEGIADSEEYKSCIQSDDFSKYAVMDC